MKSIFDFRDLQDAASKLSIDELAQLLRDDNAKEWLFTNFYANKPAKKSVFDFHTLDEVAANFSLNELLELLRSDNLQEWLNLNHYSAELEKIYLTDIKNAGTAELKLLLCDIFNFSTNNLSDEEAAEISSIIAKNQRRALFIEKNTVSAAFVENQTELVQALQDGARLIYLYKGEFHIPTNLPNITYVGRGNAIIDLPNVTDVDFDAQNIILDNLQIFIHCPITVTANLSTNIRIIDGSKETIGTRPTLKEIFDILQGRGAFESPASFKRRAEDICGVAVGTVLLVDSDYLYDAQIFKLRPRWNLNYIAAVRDFAAGKSFVLHLPPDDLSHNRRDQPTFASIDHTTDDRKLQIFADFTAVNGKLTVLSLYVETLHFGRITIDSLSTSASDKTSGYGLGYGLDIIAAFDD